MGQVYRITNKKNQKEYIGISIAKNKCYLDRFEKHMNGEGGVWIKRDIENGNAMPSDFIINVIEEHDDEIYLKLQETYYIELLDTLWPNGYNGNKGNYIVQTSETIAKSKATREQHMLDGKINLKGIHKGKAIYKYPDGTLKCLSVNHEDVLSNIVKHINFKEDGKGKLKKLAEDEQKSRNGGATDKAIMRRKLQSILWKTVHLTDWWKRGRETFRRRMERKEFTKKELTAYANRSEESKIRWQSLTEDEKLEKLEKCNLRLDKINSIKKHCTHCGKDISLGNYTRWHGDNCKKAPKWQIAY